MVNLEEAKEKGFINCVELVKILFPGRTVRWDAAYNWIGGSGLEIVYLEQDGESDIRKGLRTGIWNKDLAHVKQYKEDYYAQALLDSWEGSRQSALEAGIAEQDIEEYIGDKPPTPTQKIDFNWKMNKAKKAKADKEPDKDRDALIIEKMRNCTKNKRGLPKLGELSILCGFRVTRKERLRLWVQ